MKQAALILGMCAVWTVSMICVATGSQVDAMNFLNGEHTADWASAIFGGGAIAVAIWLYFRKNRDDSVTAGTAALEAAKAASFNIRIIANYFGTPESRNTGKWDDQWENVLTAADETLLAFQQLATARPGALKTFLLLRQAVVGTRANVLLVRDQLRAGQNPDVADGPARKLCAIRDAVIREVDTLDRLLS
jgi:hypothetical protein